MSEGLRAKYLQDGDIVGQKIGEYEYFNIGDVTFNQLAVEHIAPAAKHKAYINKKPDRLIVRRRNNTPQVVAIVEDKDSGLFGSEVERKKAIQQCANYCHAAGAKFGIITDGNETIWVNPFQPNPNTLYVDKYTDEERSYTFIRKEDGSELNAPFSISSGQDYEDLDKMPQEIKKLHELIKTISNVISEDNSTIKEPGRIDPLPLARSVWQDIWIATGKTPEKCLYNVVELFIFKFLSDLGILSERYSFEYLYQDFIVKREPPEAVLKYYVKNCRQEIYGKFPKGDDGTTIINGTIFVDEHGEANVTQAILFVETIKKFKAFETDQGKFSAHSIDKDFKTKLYEQFLKQTAGLKALGQYFTPRKVVRAVVAMSAMEDFHSGERVCDPFCGVGGFILEPLNLPSRANDFRPVNGRISSPISYSGYDKGFEKDEERTIILAKANMLIYLAELVAENKDIPQEFSKNAFNETFKLWRSNLGTLGEIEHDESKKFDLILTNPPYVKSGIKALKNEIDSHGELRSFYSVNGGGLEGLAIEWIVKHLKKGGKAFIIAPDGILHRKEDQKLRAFLQAECYIDAIVSLPSRTFYATPKKTYILALTRKDNKQQLQTSPVFTYLASSIGETLDINRFDTPEQNDLNDMVSLFRQFNSIKLDPEAKSRIESQSKLCKIQLIKKFSSSEHWLVDRWWSLEEKIELGIAVSDEPLSYNEFVLKIRTTEKFFDEKIALLNKQAASKKINYQDVPLGKVIDIVRGNSNFTLKYINENKGIFPLYSAATGADGLMGYINSFDFNEECITYTTNGANAGTVFYRPGHKFSLNGDAALVRINSENQHHISYRYLAIAMSQAFKLEGMGWEYKATSGKVRQISVRIPVDTTGKFDIQAQESLANMQDLIESIKEDFAAQLDSISNTNVSIDK